MQDKRFSADDTKLEPEVRQLGPIFYTEKQQAIFYNDIYKQEERNL